MSLKKYSKNLYKKFRLIEIFEFQGIPTKLHISFTIGIVLLLFYFALDNWALFAHRTIAIIMLMFCLVSHEYGHALAAKKYNIVTYDIVITPVGGVARLINTFTSPRQELIIALAGPFVNIVYFFFGVILYLFEIPYIHYLVYYFCLINVVMGVFNLIPAYPMDGGRVLRAALIYFTKNQKLSHKLSITISQIISVGFIIFGIIFNVINVTIIAILLLMFSQSEKHKKIIYHKN
tara:strand:+ start:2271 stop:2972 length:702 start_codon:yes stop_codon:yes gene_type:complete